MFILDFGVLLAMYWLSANYQLIGVNKNVKI